MNFSTAGFGTRTPTRPICTPSKYFWHGLKVAAWSWPDRSEGRRPVLRRAPTKTFKCGHSQAHLATLRHFFDGLMTRHAIILNPALSVRGDRYQVEEGKTPEITVQHARKLLSSIKTSSLVGLRDRAVIAILIYTAARAGAVAALRRGHFYNDAEQWMP